MRVRRTFTALVGLAAPVLGLLGSGGPAQAHGAVAEPVSRVMACAPDGPHADAEVCVAARAAGGDLTDWDNLRVAGVAGRDREVIPDGQLCSGGIARFQGLDRPDATWPATPLVAGAEITLRYRVTIPHRGTFRGYLTRDGYDPGRPLRWEDLAAEPFLTVTDPEPADGAYLLPARLPADRTGRHLIFTIWQNSDTPDTYYSCTDVILTAGTPTGTASPAAPSAPSAPDATPAPGYGTAAPDRSVDLVLTGGGTVVLAAAIAGGLGLLRRTLRRRP